MMNAKQAPTIIVCCSLSNPDCRTIFHPPFLLTHEHTLNDICENGNNIKGKLLFVSTEIYTDLAFRVTTDPT